MKEDQSSLQFSDRDEFRRRSIAIKTIKLLKSEIPVSPLIIDGDWGVGKTEFCYKLINLLKELSPTTDTNDNTTYHTVYIDAFKADHANEPLATILAAILNSLPQSGDKIEFREKAMNVLKFGTSVVSRAAVGFLLRQDAAGIPDEFDQAFKEMIDKSIDSVLKSHEKAEEKITALKAVLKEITETDQLIIFIDELDRCHPNFTIKVLENIKHIFDVEGVQFVLVANLKQIEAFVEHSYGSVNAKRYLDKFIGYSFNLPGNVYQEQEVISTSKVHFQNLLSGNQLLQRTDLAKSGYETFFNTLIAANQLSLREVETFIRHLMIYHTMASYGLKSDTRFGIIMLRVFGVFIFCFKPEIVKQLNNGIIYKIGLNELIGKKPEFDFTKRVVGNTHADLVSIIISLYALSKDQIKGFSLNQDTTSWSDQWGQSH